MDDDSSSFGFSASSKSYRSALMSRPGELRIGFFLCAVCLLRKKKKRGNGKRRKQK